MAAPTIKDVARHAGVGLGTVSRVLNNHPRVSADTRERVLQAISELGFRPNATARRLPRKSELRHIGVITHPFVLNYHSIAERLRGVQSAINAADPNLEIVLFSASSPQHYDAQLANIAHNSSVMGLLIIDLDLTDAQQLLLRTSGIPFVGLNNFRDKNWHCLGTDNAQGGYLATRTLTQLGHKRIAYMGDNLFDVHGFPTSQARYGGYAQALGEASIHLNNRYVKLGNHSYDTAFALTKELLALGQPPTAIFAMSDLQAAGCLAAVRHSNLRVPEDVSIVGYDDTELSLPIGLTTVRQHLELGGKMGVELLLAKIANTLPDPLPQVPPVEVIVRQTTAAPRQTSGQGGAGQRLLEDVR